MMARVLGTLLSGLAVASAGAAPAAPAAQSTPSQPVATFEFSGAGIPVAVAGANAPVPAAAAPVNAAAANTAAANAAAVNAATVSATPANAAPAEPVSATNGAAAPSEAGTAAVVTPSANAVVASEAAAAWAAPADEADLWGRIRHGFKMPDLDTKRTQSSTRWYAAQPDYIQRMGSRASLYLFHIVEEIEKRGMPTELALLPFVESAMQPDAVSWAKAAGLWQFMPATGRVYALEQNLWKDERLGVIESTRAALDYLQKLYAEFGDWQLALAAYNCGEAGVERALARARAAHRSVAYKDLRLPNETQFYVPKLQAIKNIVADPAHFGITLPAIRNEPYFITYSPGLDIDVTTAARLAEMPPEDFRALNPAFNRPLIVAASAPTILVPADHAETFEANLAAWRSTGQPLASWTAYTLAPGETIAAVATRAGVSEAQLREANRIPPRYHAAPGSTILVPRDENTLEDVAPGYITASFALVPEGNVRQVTVRVRKGDTLASVARKWRVSADDIVAWNHLRSMGLFAGQRLTLTVTRAAAPQPATHKATRARHPAKATRT
jgi:membrane-bound lytic murein transglycosylase D